jgi:hypothetical protein
MDVMGRLFSPYDLNPHGLNRSGEGGKPGASKSASLCPRLTSQSPTKSAADGSDRHSGGFNGRRIFRQIDTPIDKILEKPDKGMRDAILRENS